jgi:hypothetical protein
LIRQLLAITACLTGLIGPLNAASTAHSANEVRLAVGEHTAVLNGTKFHYVVSGHGPFAGSASSRMGYWVSVLREWAGAAERTVYAADV